jgi:hypothetical protein
MISHRFRVPSRPTGSLALSPAKAAARQVYAQAMQELIGLGSIAGASFSRAAAVFPALSSSSRTISAGFPAAPATLSIGSDRKVEALLLEVLHPDKPK